jgi:GntR family transcriptional repressor for pyruvate dehydrogenase complex
MHANPGVNVFNTSLQKRTLAQQVADSIKESVLRGELSAGEALPTEPELATQFGVSRAVVRDAVRLLSALGLVDVRHGRGMYITEPGTDALAEALFIALRRRGASVWDVEELQQVLLPRIIALAAERAGDEEIAALESSAEGCLSVFGEVIAASESAGRELTEEESVRVAEAYGSFYERLYAASHNRVIALLARPLYRLHSLKSWDSDEEPVKASVEREREVFNMMIEAIRSRDPAAAAAAGERAFDLYPESAREAMRRTPIGDRAVLPEGLPRPGRDNPPGDTPGPE